MALMSSCQHILVFGAIPMSRSSTYPLLALFLAFALPARQAASPKLSDPRSPMWR